MMNFTWAPLPSQNNISQGLLPLQILIFEKQERTKNKMTDAKSSSKCMSPALGILKMKTSNSFMHDSLSVEALNILVFPLSMN
jgi:hypothetical protein